MFRNFVIIVLLGFSLMIQCLWSVDLVRQNSMTPMSPLAGSSAIPSTNSIEPKTFRARVGLEDLPQITDVMIQNELDSLKGLQSSVQEAIIKKIHDEMKNIRADGATPEMVKFFWEEDVPYISWERYKKWPGQTFANFYNAIRSNSDEAFLAFLGLKSPVVQEDIENAFEEIKTDLDRRIKREPKLTVYYTPIKDFFDELEKLPKA